MFLPAQVVRFGSFQLDVRAAELRLNGDKTKLPEQPFQVLSALLEKPGEVVTREELRQRLWGADTFVDFEHGLNTAVKRLREALGDSAENPRFIETLPRHGYRLIVPVEKLEPIAAVPASAARRWPLWLAVGAVVVVAVAAGLVWRHVRVERLRTMKIESLAVLPLENLSGNHEEIYFADGMTEALITELGKIHALRVISRQSVMQYRGTNKTVPQIAHELHIDAVVEGSALRSGGKVRITMQLIQANPERHLWSESYERNLSDVIALQRDVTQAIAREIRVSLTPAEQQRLAQARPVSPEAYEAFLKGLYFVGRLESRGKSAEYFQQAISRDPYYAPAYVGLAISYPPGAGHEKALPLIKKALELDDTLAEAHAALATFLEDENRDWAGAEREYLRALELDPGSAVARHWYGMFLLEVGRIEEALAENQRALQLNPTGRFVNAALAIKLVYLGRYDEAVAQAKAGLEMDTNSPNAHFALGLAYSKKGIREQAISELKRAVALAPDFSGYMGALAYVYAVFGQASDACRVAEEMRELATRARVGPSHVATAYTACGRNEEAFRWLERAYREHDPDLSYMKVDFMLDQLRPDPRFQDLLRRMNFPQ